MPFLSIPPFSCRPLSLFLDFSSSSFLPLLFLPIDFHSFTQMSSTFPLPLECLQLIIHHLIAQRARKSVAALLCVNKHVCSATLPILYRDPFVDMVPVPPISPISTHTNVAGFGFGYGLGTIDKTNKTVLGLMHLVRMLLLSMPPSAPFDDQHDRDDRRELVTELVRVAFFPNQKKDQD